MSAPEHAEVVRCEERSSFSSAESSSACRVLLMGNPRWVEVLTKELRDSGIWAHRHCRALEALRRLEFAPLVRVLRAKIVHQVSGVTECGRLMAQASRLGKKVVMHWIGTDVIYLREYVVRHRQLPPFMSEYVDLHLADSPALRDELAKLGVAATVVRLLPQRVEAEIIDLPAEPAVLSYWQDTRAVFYGANILAQVARHLPEVTFYIVGATDKSVESPPPNFVFLGEVPDMDEVYRKVNVLFRFVEHDSLSGMVLEALARGRFVLYSHGFPHTIQIRDVDNAVAALRSILACSQPNLAGAAHVREHFSWRKEMSLLKRLYAELTAS